MRDVYRAGQITSSTGVYGVLSAEPISDNLIASLNGTTRDAGLDAVWLPFRVSEASGDGPAKVVKAFRSLGIGGYLVEGSARSTAGASLEIVSSSDRSGRVNVIRLVDGRTVGDWSERPEDAFSLITRR